MSEPQITILGVGNILYRDEGVGIRAVERIETLYAFPDHIVPVDGGVLGVNLMGVISQADKLVVIDAVYNGGQPGDLHRLAGKQIPQRIVAKNSLHQVDLLEALTLCSAIDKHPETVIVGIEPLDIETLDVGLTPLIESRLDELIDMALKEVVAFGGSYRRRETGETAD
ncbi:MAG: HyaD/HybD family hydrogenase maturation endopeptidase [Desulfosarcinaceae bacterium]|nr:HyaD/HybD family hydrogenase maturation endopeptidase [Desulfosarcinaceae bacterium]